MHNLNEAALIWRQWMSRMLRVVTNIASIVFMVVCIIPVVCIAQTYNNPVESDSRNLLKMSSSSQRMISIEAVIFVVDADKKIDLGFFNENVIVNNDFPPDVLKELIDRAETEPGLKIIGIPQVKVIEGKTAEFKVEDDETGKLNLKITPQITGNGSADYKIEVVRKRAYAERIGVIRNRTLTANITVKDGGTFAVGGITAKDVGITSGIKRELCVFLTSHIVK